jgi:hypothetical protein
MSLPPSIHRDLIHLRDIDLRGYKRQDGLWDIEGWLTDRKAYSFDSHFRGMVSAGDAVHDMGLRLTLDDHLTIVDVVAVMSRHPYQVCPGIAANFRKLIGLKIGGGFNREARALMGGVEGCTHLVELLGPMATTAMQTIFPMRKAWKPETTAPGAATRKPPLVDSCHAFRADGPVVKRQWPDFYTGPKSE